MSRNRLTMGICGAAWLVLILASAELYRQQTSLQEITEGAAETPAAETETLHIVVETDAPEYLADLSSYEPGDILEEELLDPEHMDRYFTGREIVEGDEIYTQIIGKSYQENDDIALSDLRYLKLIHYNFQDQIQVGELIVNKDLEEDFIEIFQELLAEHYQIEAMRLIDNYWTGDPEESDTASIEVNNTSCFCYRSVTGGKSLSNHALGRAIDLNPQQNPYVTFNGAGKPSWSHKNADDYIDRTTGAPHMITHEDTAFLIFQRHGFFWGGDWNNPKDYQHFEKN